MIETIGFGLFALFMLGGAFLLSRLMGRSQRNEGSNHGGGWEASGVARYGA